MEKSAIFYDTETTGIKPGKDRIIEIAAVFSGLEKKFSTLVNPGCPIPPEATAIHGISDAMVAEAPQIKEALIQFADFCSEGAVLVAHNNDAFDKLFLEAEFIHAGLSIPSWTFVDSLKWSRKYRKDLPRHSLQFLRETYEIPANQSHRALDDCIILHEVFRRMIDDLSIEKVIELLSGEQKIERMPFGKHAGMHLSEVPKGYLDWLKQSGALDKPENSVLKDAFDKLGRI